MLGIGLGFDYLNYDAKQPPPFYSDKDIHIAYFRTWKYFALEARQALRSDYFFNNSLRNNSLALLGFSTIKEKMFSFNMLFGGDFSFMNNKSFDYYYPPQINPTLKVGFCFRLSKTKRIFLGLDAFISSLHYNYKVEHGGEVGSVTSSALLSINYQFSNNKENVKN